MAKIRQEEWTLKAPLVYYLIVYLGLLWTVDVSRSLCSLARALAGVFKVSFPVQMLGKSFKMMPVMLWGIVISLPDFKRGACQHKGCDLHSKVQELHSQGRS